MACVIEKHPFKQLIKPDTKYLVIGTFPAQKKNLQYQFFYSGKRNNFWKIIEGVYNHQFVHNNLGAAVFEREVFLQSKQIGMTDMHEVCWRNGYSAEDSALYSIKLRDIFSILTEFPSIERLILTSRTKGYGVVGLLETYFIQQGKQFPSLKVRHDKIMIGEFVHNERRIEILVPYSPSPRLTDEGRTTIPELIKMYGYCLQELIVP